MLKALVSIFLLLLATPARAEELPQPRLPAFAGAAASLSGPPTLTVGGGFVRGSKVGTTQLNLGFSPATLAVWESGGGPARAFFGLQSAPLFLWLSGDEGGGITLAMADVGWTFGSDRLRVGPYATIGVIAMGAGVRTVWTPLQTRTGDLRGIEARLTWYARSTGHVGIYFVRTIPMGAPELYRTPVPDAVCRRFVVAAGMGSSVSSTDRAWELVGQDQATAWSSSPALALGCESGEGPLGWYAGGETAPRMSYRVPTLDGGSDRVIRHFGSLTAGPTIGTPRVRIGPIATVGIWALGGGGRAAATPFTSRRGAEHGLEVRALVMAPSAPSGELLLLYHVAIDPRGS